MAQIVKRIPYAIADYRLMRQANGYYVDKTHFIPLLEAAPYYLFCIRPPAPARASLTRTWCSTFWNALASKLNCQSG